MVKNVPIANQWPTACCCNELQKQSQLSDLCVHHLPEQGVDFMHWLSQDFQNFSTKVPLIAVASKLVSLWGSETEPESPKFSQSLLFILQYSCKLAS